MQVKPEWAGKSLRELKLRNRYQMNVIAVKENLDSEAVIHIDPDMKLKSEMTLWVLLDANNVERLV